MSKFSFLIFLNAYSDRNPSNAPSLNNFKYTRELNSVSVNNPDSLAFDLAPGESRVLFNGTRTLAQDNTTQYSIALKPLSSNTYVLSRVSGAAPNFRTPRVTGASAATAVNVSINGPLATYTSAPSVAAAFTGQVAGMTTDVTLTAVTPGSAGNSIVLNFDGILTLAAVISNWNMANPSNNVSLTAGVGTQIPDNATSITLSGGITRVPFNLISGGAVVGDHARIGGAFNLGNQGEFKILAVTATSFTVANEAAAAEGPIQLSSDYANEVQIYSAAGVQVNDTLNIQSGFSLATVGFYKVTSVSANSLEFFSSDVLPEEGPITTQGIVIYSMAKSFIYMESNEQCQITMNGSNIAMIKPFIVNNCAKPGIFANTAAIYSLSVTNTSSDTAKLFLASVE